MAGGDKPLAALAAEVGRQAAELHLALYDGGEALRLVPALDAAALEENRPADDDASPWLSFQAMLYGSDDLLRAYPQAELRAVRRAFAEAKSAYLDRGAADRPARFAAAMNRFAAAVRDLGERIEPLRAKLPILHRDQSLIDATAYPPPGSTAAEVFYNRLDPFFWAWLVSVAAMLCLLSAVGRWREAGVLARAGAVGPCPRVHRRRIGAADVHHRPGAADGDVRVGGRRGAVRGAVGSVVHLAAAGVLGGTAAVPPRDASGGTALPVPPYLLKGEAGRGAPAPAVRAGRSDRQFVGDGAGVLRPGRRDAPEHRRGHADPAGQLLAGGSRRDDHAELRRRRYGDDMGDMALGYYLFGRYVLRTLRVRGPNAGTRRLCRLQCVRPKPARCWPASSIRPFK